MASPFSGWIRLLVVGLLVGLSASRTPRHRASSGPGARRCCRKTAAAAMPSAPSADSPLKAATPMRKIYAKFAPRELQAELREGMVSRHREMPQIEFSDEERRRDPGLSLRAFDPEIAADRDLPPPLQGPDCLVAPAFAR